MPYTQTVIVEAESQDDALLAFGDKVDAEAWVVEADYAVELDDVEVDAISPEDDEDDADEDVE
jgi:hypothetical protein